MTLSSYLNFNPEIGQKVFIADGAKIIGRVRLEDDSNVWFNTVIRGDVNFIHIGKRTNVQDMCMFHVTEQNSITVGENTSFGHSVVLHGCKIGNGCLIGMGAIILDGAEIGDNCLVAAGSLVPPGKKYPAGSFIKGRPAIAERPLTPEEIQRVSHHYESYLGYKEQYLRMNSEIEGRGNGSDFSVFIGRINKHHLFMLASSMAYYAALSLAPMLLIILSIASFVGEDIHRQILEQVSLIAPDVTQTLKLVFDNLQDRVDIGSVSGLVGLGFLLFIASFVFLQLRLSLDMIYGHHDPHQSKSFIQIVKEQGSMMFIVIIMCILFAASLMIEPLFDYLLAERFENKNWKDFIQMTLTLCILFVLFTGLYFFTPTQKKKMKDCALMGIITSATFQGGNVLTGIYMKTVALDSLYGAAGALLIFLLWAFYSSLAIFLSVEVVEFFREKHFGISPRE